jgi:hypothetical protein
MTIEIRPTQTHGRFQRDVWALGDATVVSKRLAALRLRHRTRSGRRAVEA